MDSTPTNTPTTDPPIRRVLAVADWNLDPQTVVAALSAHDQDHPSLFGLLVPARLHGLDWAGDPDASRPCAERQLVSLERLCRKAGIPVEVGRVGDPEPAPAIGDSLTDWPAEEILLFGRGRRLDVSHPLALARRLERATGLPVTRIGVSAPTAPTAGRRRLPTAPHCLPVGMKTASR